MLQILDINDNILGQLQPAWKKTYLGDWGGINEVLKSCILQIQKYHSLCLLHFSTVG